MSSSCVTLVKIIIITNRRQMCTFNSWDWTFFMFACNNADDCRYNATHLLEITQIHSLIIVCTWCQLLNGMLALAINQYSSYSVLLLPTVYVIIATFSFVFHWLPFPRFLHPTYIKYYSTYYWLNMVSLVAHWTLLWLLHKINEQVGITDIHLCIIMVVQWC